MATRSDSPRYRTFEKVCRETTEESKPTVDPTDIGTVSLSEIRRRLSR